jgi:hypothetical protein
LGNFEKLDKFLDTYGLPKLNHEGKTINLTKEVKDLYNENYKSLKKEIEEDIRRWKDLYGHGVAELILVKMTTLPKTIYVFITIPIKIPMTFLRDWKIIPKVPMEAQNTLNIKGNAEKNDNTGDITISDFKLYTESSKKKKKKKEWCWDKNRHKDKLNRIEDQDINSHSCNHLIFHKGAKNMMEYRQSL